MSHLAKTVVCFICLCAVAWGTVIAANAQQVGLAVIDGAYVSPPYEIGVTTVGEEALLALNGRTLKKRKLKASPDSERLPQSLVTAFDGVEYARQQGLRRNLIGIPSPSEQKIATFVDELNALDSELEFSIEDNLIIVVDPTGQRASLNVQEAARVSDAETIELLKLDAEQMNELLRSGGILVASDGVISQTPRLAASELAQALLKAATLPMHLQVPFIEAHLGSNALAASIVGGNLFGSAVLSHLKKIFASNTEASAPRSTSRAICADHDVAASHHSRSRTPAEQRAYIFSPVTVESGMTCNSTAVKDAVGLHGYSVVEYDGDAATYARLRAASGRAGVLYICAHGSMQLDPVDNQQAALNRAQSYINDTGITDFSVNESSSGQWYVVVPKAARSGANWRDRNTIVVYEGCSTAYLVRSFGAREAIGYVVTCPGPADPTWVQFWERLSGVRDSGTRRNVGDAFDATFPAPASVTADIMHTSRDNGRTVLSPAVVACEPSQPLPVGVSTTVRIGFDAKMEKAFGSRIPEVVGCDAVISNARFSDDYTLTFDVTPRTQGQLAIAALNSWANSADDVGIKLDGNGDPRYSNHVGPNEDDFVWFVDCQ